MRARRHITYPAPRAAIELVALGLTASEAVKVVAALPTFADNFARVLYVDRVTHNRGHDMGLGGAREWCDRHGFLSAAPKASGAVGGVRYVL